MYMQPMKKHYVRIKPAVISLSFFLLSFFGGLAQKDPAKDGQKDSPKGLLSILSADQRFVRLAVDSSICLIRQEYTLIDARGNEYGRNSDPFFGRQYGLGVISDSGIWVGAELSSPWTADRNFEKFRSSDSLTPHLGKTFLRRPGQGGFTQLTNHPATPATNHPATPAVRGSLFCMGRPEGLASIPCSFDVKDTAGWLVLLTTGGGTDIGDTTHFVYNTFQPKLSFADPSGKGYLKNMPEENNLVGGIYYTCAISLGKISFAAAGILQKDEKGWYIHPFPGRGAGQLEAPDRLSPVKKTGVTGGKAAAAGGGTKSKL